MFDCEVLLYDKSHYNPESPYGHLSEFWAQDQFTKCFVSTQDHYIYIYTKRTDPEPFYKSNTTKVALQLDARSKTLSFTQIKDNALVLKIKSDTSVLEKIERFCKENSNETKLWNPLLYTPCNKVRESSINITQNASNIRGIANLILVALIFSKINTIINNYATYGLVHPDLIILPSSFQTLLMVSSIVLTTIIMFLTEKLAFMKIIPSSLITLLEIGNILVLITAPGFFCYFFELAPPIGMAYTGWNIMILLKMISYIHVMREVRETFPQVLLANQNKATSKENEITRENLEVIRKYASNISGIVNVKDLMYFYFAPTLTFQLWYPRNPTIRWGWLARTTVELILCWLLFFFTLNQYVNPIFEPAAKTFKVGTLSEIARQIVAFGDAYIFSAMLFFYGFFHLFTNVLAEALRFADREFYKSWWNSQGISHFWSLWNLPVHRWCTRHLYYPLLKRGYSKSFAACTVFLFSGFMHEYMCCLSLRIITIFSTFLFFGQAPLLIIEKKYDKFFRSTQLGNIIFWAVFWFICNPIAILFYYAQYLTKYSWNK